MIKLMENKNIYLRKLSKEDATLFFALNNDKEVLKYTGDLPFENRAAARNFLINYPNYKRDGFGRWAVCLQENDTFLGWCGLNRSLKTGETDIGFRFFKCYWGNGYATESAKMCLNYGFTDLKLKSIIGHAYMENMASVRVLEKCNMILVKNIKYDDRAAFMYRAKAVRIQEIKPTDTHPLRSAILRKQIPLPTVFFGDSKPTTFHLGALKSGDSKIIGVATFVAIDFPMLKGVQCQLRGMAISEASQGMGIGKLLLEEAVYRLQKRNCEYIWCNAREIAVSFYTKQGFEILGNSFEIEYIGTHYTMFKKI